MADVNDMVFGITGSKSRRQKTLLLGGIAITIPPTATLYRSVVCPSVRTSVTLVHPAKAVNGMRCHSTGILV